MALFQKTVDVWGLSDAERALLQPGQHVKTTGDERATGRWCGQTIGGSVVAWNGNARGKAGYLRTCREYAKRNGAR